jgi:hypothetical protein
MSYHVPFHEQDYVPKSIKGNAESQTPVRFYLSAAGGPDLARVKSIIHATRALALERTWSPQVQESVTAAFKHGADVFVKTVDRIDNLTVPMALALKAGLVALPAKGAPALDRAAPFAIDTGDKFSKICGWLSILAFEVAMQIGIMSDEANPDPRFFGSSTTSRGTSASGSGSARAARKRRAGRETVDSKAPTANTGTTTAP